MGPWDAWVRSGRSALKQSLPLTLGADLAGQSMKSARASPNGGRATSYSA